MRMRTKVAWAAALIALSPFLGWPQVREPLPPQDQPTAVAEVSLANTPPSPPTAIRGPGVHQAPTDVQAPVPMSSPDTQQTPPNAAPVAEPKTQVIEAAPEPVPAPLAAAPPDEPDDSTATKSATGPRNVLANRRARPLGKPAKEIFGAISTPSKQSPQAVGFYAKGCLAGARNLAIDGPAWQAMRLSRNRNWGHPELIRLVERLAVTAQKDGWPGLLVGDMSQPRGGPMLTGHASHQVGLDADIWLTPMPARRMSRQDREDLEATSMLAPGDLSVDPTIWTPSHQALLKRAASAPEVERILVHPAIKKAVCEGTAGDADRAWLGKVRPYWGHNYHFHMRISCPAGSVTCRAQPPPRGDDGCGKELTDWMKQIEKSAAAAALRPPPPLPRPVVPPGAPAAKPKGKPQITLDQLPAECRGVLGLPPLPPPPPAKTAAAAAKSAPTAPVPALAPPAVVTASPKQ